MNSSVSTQKESENSFSIRRKPSSLHNKSFSYSFPSPSSSSQSSSSYSSPNLDSPLSPTSLLLFSGVPFAWEKHPGIPKQSNCPSSNQNPSLDLLPLPPAASSKKKILETTTVGRDPFIAALMECSKDHARLEQADCWKSAKVSRSLSNRFGFIDLYTSCKNTCSVADSMVYLPPPSETRSYNPVKRRSYILNSK